MNGGIVNGMVGATGIIAMFASALLIAIADGLIKKTSASGTLLPVVLFGEHLSLWQGIGIVLALVGAVLINSGL